MYKQGGVVDPEEGCDIGTPDRANEEPNNDEMAAARVQYVYLVPGEPHQCADPLEVSGSPAEAPQRS